MPGVLLPACLIIEVIESNKINMAIDLYLASASPRRKELLESMGLQIECCPANIEEIRQAAELPNQYVERLAVEKANAALSLQAQPQETIPFLGADTIVVCNGEVFEKPQDQADAMRMWHAMSGGQHQVLTAIAVLGIIDGELQKYTALSTNNVTLKAISNQEMSAYWQSGDPQDKAGAYGIQGRASAWVESIEGSFSGIMGLPLYETNQLLRHFGLNWL